MRRILIIILLTCPFLPAAHADTPGKQEACLQKLYAKLYSAPSDLARLDLNDSVCLQLHATLSQATSFEYPFDSLPFLGKVYSTDRKLRFYSWNYISDQGDYSFFTIIQRQADNKLFFLAQNRPSYMPDEDKTMDANSWYGALYYNAIPYVQHDITYYLLLGWSHYSDAENFKTIEVLSLNDNHVSFGLPIFSKGDTLLTRVVLPYSSRHSLSLQYDNIRKLFYFNHLHSLQNSDTQLPDETFSAYVLTKDGLKYQDEITLQSDKHEEKLPRDKMQLDLDEK